MELALNDYNCNINYCPNKSNVAVDAHSRKASRNFVIMITTQNEILRNLEKYEIEVVIIDNEAYLAKLIVQP